MKVLITGAAGFMGRNFSRAHRERGDTVHGLDDLSSPHAKWDDEAQNITGDAGMFFDGWSSDIDMGYDVVYHFAAPVGGREKIEGDPLFNAGSLRLDAALFRWAAKFGQRAAIVFPSSSAVYEVGDQTRSSSRPLREQDFDPTNEYGAFPHPDEIYGLSKMVGEVLAAKAANYGVNTLCIRPFSGYGPDQSLEYPVPSIARRVAKHENPLVVWGSGLQARDFIYIDDVVGATLARLDAGVYGYQAMNIGTGEFHTFNQIAEMCAQAEKDYTPAIENLTDKPQGVDKRYCDPSLMLEYYTPVVQLPDGLARVVEAQRA